MSVFSSSMGRYMQVLIALAEALAVHFFVHLLLHRLGTHVVFLLVEVLFGLCSWFHTMLMLGLDCRLGLRLQLS